jgi:exodeoxyribonuclease VII large subunit
MQGKDVEPTIIAALDKIASNLNRWDAVVIIRGGGATSDLSGFDTLELAENVAQFPLPIITGIGHERDFTVLDMIAHTRVKTPTAAAEFLIHHQEEELDYVEELAEKITQTTSNILFNEKKRLQLATNKLPSLFTNLKLREEAKMERLMAYMHNRMTQQIMKDKSHTELLEQQLTLLSRSLLDKEKNKLEVFENKIKNAAPERILQLGFTITRTNGKVVKDASSIKKGDVLDTTFANGTIKSIAE